MCKNGRNRCSVFAALEKNGEADAAITAFVRMVRGRKAQEEEKRNDKKAT